MENRSLELGEKMAKQETCGTPRCKNLVTEGFYFCEDCFAKHKAAKAKEKCLECENALTPMGHCQVCENRKNETVPAGDIQTTLNRVYKVVPSGADPTRRRPNSFH